MEEKYTVLGAFAVLDDRARGKVLMVKRRVAPYPALWSLPGGFVEENKHPTKTIVEKVKEETGYLVEKPQEPSDFIGHYPFSGQKGFYQAAIYITNIISGEKLDKDNISWVGYTSVFSECSALTRLVARNKVAKPVVKILKDLKLIEEE